MAVDTKAIQPPIHPYLLPAVLIKEPIGPLREFLPKANSLIINGTDQINRNITHGIKKEPPPFWATILENLHILPVPIEIPRADNIKPHLEVKKSCFSNNSIFSLR
jgi:hypothetical protein